MRISDWSSDVCSSDLRTPPSSFAISPMKGQTFIRQRLPGPSELAFPGSGSKHMTQLFSSRPVDGDTTRDPQDDSTVWVTAIMLPSPSTPEKGVVEARSSEQRVGNEGDSACSSGRSAYNYKKNTRKTMND